MAVRTETLARVDVHNKELPPDVPTEATIIRFPAIDPALKIKRFLVFERGIFYFVLPDAPETYLLKKYTKNETRPDFTFLQEAIGPVWKTNLMRMYHQGDGWPLFHDGRIFAQTQYDIRPNKNNRVYVPTIRTDVAFELRLRHGETFSFIQEHEEVATEVKIKDFTPPRGSHTAISVTDYPREVHVDAVSPLATIHQRGIALCTVEYIPTAPASQPVSYTSG